MNNNIQCSIESSTTKIELNSAVDGVFLVPELEGLVGLPEIRTTSGVNAGYDGGWTSAQNYDARLISIRGVIANPDISKVEDKRRAIASLLGQGRKEQLTLRFTTEAGNAYAISVRTISCEMALQRVLTTQEFLIQLRADDPLIYDDGTTGGIAAILQPQRALGGFEINFGLPLAIGGGAEDTVVDNGNETVYPVIKMYGALHSPTVVNRTTNQQMQILADLQYSIDWHTYRSATGDYILVSDGLNGAPMTLSQLTGNAEQTTYSGKNLANYLDAVKATNDTTITFVDNGFRQVTTSAGFGTKLQITGLAASTTYTISWSLAVTSGTASKVARVFEGTSQSVTYAALNQVPTGAGHLTFTTGASATSVNVWFYNGIPSAGDTTWTNIMCEKGSSATDYEPYVGGTPAPNPQFPMPISTVTGAQTVGVTGKNLLGLQDDTLTSNGVNFAISNGTITASGTTTAASNAENDNIIGDLSRDGNYPVYATITEANSIELRAGTYTVSAEITKTGETSAGIAFGTGATMGARITGLTKLEVLTNDATGTYTKTATFTIAEGERLYVSTYYEGNATKKNVGFTISNIQLELGSQKSNYEPYQSQSYEVNLASKNMLDPSWMVAGYMATTGGAITYTQTQGEMACEEYIPVEPNTEYTFEIFETTDTYPEWFGISQYSTADTSGFVERSVKTGANPQTWFYTIRTKTNTHYIRPSARNLQHATKYMLSKGGRTSYAPYFTPIELAKVGTYQDRIYKNDGKWYIEKQVGKVVLDGANADILWSLTTTGSSYSFWYRNNTMGAKTTEHPKLCDRFTYSADPYTTAPTPSLCENLHPSYDGGYMTIFKVDSTIATTVDGWKAWLASNPTTVYYALATPTTTEITDETLRAQLNLLASLYKGENNISLVGTGAQGEMVIRYATDYTVNQDVITIDSQARTITLNGQDVYHLKTSESEFLVLAPGENKLYLTSEVSDDSGYAEVKFKQGYLSI